MIRIEIDPGGLFKRQVSDVIQRQIPYATMLANNRTAWATRQAWKAEIPRVFSSPVPLTRNAVLYNKAERGRPYAEIFIRDEAFKGTPPATYLQAQVHGGPRRAKRMEMALRHQGLLQADQFLVPTSAVLSGGKLRGNIATRMLSQLRSSSDAYANQSAASRRRRHSREGRQKGYTTDYFVLRRPRGKLKPGVYLRTNLGRLGSSVVPHFLIVKTPTYHERFDIFGMAERLFRSQYPQHFRRALRDALRTAR